MGLVEALPMYFFGGQNGPKMDRSGVPKHALHSPTTVGQQKSQKASTRDRYGTNKLVRYVFVQK